MGAFRLGAQTAEGTDIADAAGKSAGRRPTISRFRGLSPKFEIAIEWDRGAS